jgi:uncharacterized protein with HEPN domain
MPEHNAAASEHALMQEITAPLANLPDDPVRTSADVEFPLTLRGYDRIAVDAYVKQTSQLVAELQATRSPEAAVRRALERIGEQVSSVLQRAHETAETITSQSRAEADDRLELARLEAAQIKASAEAQLKELDADTDRIWAERHRIVSDARELARELLQLADSAAERFPPEESEAASNGESEDAGRGAPPAGRVEAPDGEAVTERPLPDEEEDASTAAFPQLDGAEENRDRPTPH